MREKNISAGELEGYCSMSVSGSMKILVHSCRSIHRVRRDLPYNDRKIKGIAGALTEMLASLLATGEAPEN